MKRAMSYHVGTVAVLTHSESVFVWMAGVETAVKVSVTRWNGSRRIHAHTQKLVSSDQNRGIQKYVLMASCCDHLSDTTQVPSACTSWR
jgi:hypothetical protein